MLAVTGLRLTKFTSHIPVTILFGLWFWMSCFQTAWQRAFMKVMEQSIPRAVLPRRKNLLWLSREITLPVKKKCIKSLRSSHPLNLSLLQPQAHTNAFFYSFVPRAIPHCGTVFQHNICVLPFCYLGLL